MIAMCAVRTAHPIKQESEESGRGLAAEERRKRRDEGGVAARRSRLAAGNDRGGARLEARRGAEGGAGDADLAKLLVQRVERVPVRCGADARYGLRAARLEMPERVQQRRLGRDEQRRREEEPPEPAQYHRTICCFICAVLPIPGHLQIPARHPMSVLRKAI